MKMLKRILLIFTLLVLTACTEAEINAFLGDYNNYNTRRVLDYDEGLHNHYIYLSENQYYSRARLDVATFYEHPKTQNGNYRVDIEINGKIYSKAKVPLVAVVYLPMINSDGYMIREVVRDFITPPYDVMNINVYEYQYSGRKAYIPIKDIVVAIYCQEELVGTNKPEFFRNNNQYQLNNINRRQHVENHSSQRRTRHIL